MKTIKIAPSILSADFRRLADDIRRVEDAGADLIHIDIMDAHFVPNLSMGPGIVESIRNVTRLHFDVHLMMDNPQRFLRQFREAGADGLTVHLEIFPDPEEALDEIGALGLTRGLSLNPDMPVRRLSGRLTKVDRLLVMCVYPGFGGQAFIPESLTRIREARDLLDAEGRAQAELEVDGGVNVKNAAAIREAGADLLVGGTAVFGAPSAGEAIRLLRGC
ncbi:MAG: ribulose-phosphate 3-epimerase [Planctomycetota bacterium]|jgi:ribulose-phosphate 3-epimerase|nr:ribulose-phosphate 3-epimerase [Planctomycetota bacterium]